MPTFSRGDIGRKPLTKLEQRRWARTMRHRRRWSEDKRIAYLRQFLKSKGV